MSVKYTTANKPADNAKLFYRLLTGIFCCCLLLTANMTFADELITSMTEEEKAKNRNADIRPNEPTPQPPVVTPKSEPSYEPDLDSKTEHGTASQPADRVPDESTKTEQDIIPDTDKSTDIDESDSEKDTASWLDTRPKKVSADWIQLISGEWLRGELISMQKADLEFDSDELDVLVIELKKVKYLKSARPFSVRFDDNITTAGIIEITEDTVYVYTDYGNEKYKRSALQIIATGKNTELSRWSAKASLSLNIRQGNTEQTDFTTRLNAKRRTLISRLVLDYLGNFTEVKDTETVNNHRLNATLDAFITRDFFWTLISAEYYRDPFQNISRRISAYTALGYSLIDTDKTEWEVSAGPGYQSTQYVSVTDGSTNDETFIMVLSTRFDTELTSRVDINGQYIATLGDERVGGYYHHALLTVETELTNRLDFDVGVIWDRTRDPVPNENNEIPKPDDYRFIFGLGYEL